MSLFVNQFSGDAAITPAELIANPTQQMLNNLSAEYVDISNPLNVKRYKSDGEKLIQIAFFNSKIPLVVDAITAVDAPALGLVDGDVIQARGTDGREYEYDFVTPDTTTADEGLIVAPAVGLGRFYIRIAPSAVVPEVWGASPSASAATNRTQMQKAFTARAGDYLLIPKGTYSLSDVLSIPAAGLTLEGHGEDSVLEISANNKVLLSLVAGGKLRLYNIRLKGDGTASSSANGIGLSHSDSGGIDLDTVWFENFGFAGWAGTSLTSDKMDIQGRNLRFIDGKNALAGENGDIYLRGKFKSVLLENIYSSPAASSPVRQGVVIVEAIDAERWESVTLRSLRHDPTRPFGQRVIGIASEISETTNRVGRLLIDDVKAFGCPSSAIKTKNVDYIQMSNVQAKDCDTVPEIAGNLQGSVFINGCENFQGTNIVVENAGTDGIRFLGRAAGNAAGAGRSKIQLTNFICDGADESGIYLGICTDTVSLNAPQIYDAAIGIRLQATISNAAPQRTHINSPIIRRTLVNGDGIALVGLSTDRVGSVFINNPEIREAGGFGISANHVERLSINGGTVTDSGQGGSANKAGVRVSNTTYLKMVGVTSTNEGGATQDFGLSLGGGNANLCLHGNDFSGNATGPVSYAAPSASVKASNNTGWLEGVRTAYDPVSLAAGATATFDVTVPGLLASDVCSVACSLALSGTAMTANFQSANTARVVHTNPTAGTVDIASCSITVRATR